MWKDYSKSYIQNNPASSLSVIIAAFISALLLSLLCSLFYNFWMYEIDRLKREEGGWHSRVTGELDEEDLLKIQQYASVEKAVFDQETDDGITIDIYYADKKRVFRDTPQIVDLLGDKVKTVTYHYSLLAMYLIRDSSDRSPRAVFPILLAIMAMACVSLIMMIHNAFAVSMNARIHQFGIFSSVGATPGQIRICLLQEAAMLCSVPVLLGSLLGILLSAGGIGMTNLLAENVPGRALAVWSYHPFLFVITLFITVVTIWISAWIPARKIGRLTPLEAMKNIRELSLKKKKRSRLLSLLFGVEGELAGNALKAQKRCLRTANLALVISFSAFFLMQSFFTLTRISQRMTYYARYQDAWDIMVTLKDTQVGDFRKVDELQALLNVRSVVAYQKASAKRLLTADEISDELKRSESFAAFSGEAVSEPLEGWLAPVPILVMDDEGFLEYCSQIGAPGRIDGAVILNRVNDSTAPNFRIRNYIPYVKEEPKVTQLQSALGERINGERVEIPVLFYTQTVPVLREAYDEQDHLVLVHILPASLWEDMKGRIGGVEEDTYIRILGREDVSLPELCKLEEDALKVIGGEFETESTNRIQDKITNDQMINGMMLILGGFCVLLAIIGIGNVFSNTLGFVYQRNREFARYQSIGLAPGGIKKMFAIEALVIAGRPALIALCLTAVATWAMVKAAYLEPIVFLREMPVVPVFTFFFFVFLFVALAYYLGGRKVLRGSLVEALRDDRSNE